MKINFNCILLFSLLIFAENLGAKDNPGQVKVFGEVNNYVSYQSRTGYTDELGLYYLLPSDRNLNEVGLDLNNESSVQFLNLASKLGVEWNGFRSKTIGLGAKIEADFFVAGSTKTTALRLREAYFTADWNLMHRSAGIFHFIAGQNIHPLAQERPATISLSCGAPFNPYGFAPQLGVRYQLADWTSWTRLISISAAALWQSEFCSTGPDGRSMNYINWSKTPEFFASLAFDNGIFTAKVGADILSIKPRSSGLYPLTSVTVPVKDRITTKSFFAFIGYTDKLLSVKAKSLLAEGGEHLLMTGGYAFSKLTDEDGNRSYSPYRSSSSWVSLSYGNKFKGSIMVGYYKNLGTADSIYSSLGIYFNNDCYNILDAYRIAPSFEVNLKHFKAGIEYELTNASYGDKSSIDLANGLAANNLRRLSSHRISLLLSCRF